MSLLKSPKMNSEVVCQLSCLLKVTLPGNHLGFIQTGISQDSPRFSTKCPVPLIASSQGLGKLRQLTDLVVITRLMVSEASRWVLTAVICTSKDTLNYVRK